MKAFVRLTLATALLVSMAGFTAAPAGAAGGTSCTVPTGKINVSPGLTTTPTKNKITFTLPLVKCKGGGVTSGTSVGVIPPGKPGTCGTVATAPPMTLTTTIKWNNKTTSTFTGKTGLSAKAPKGFIALATVTGTVTKGAFAKMKVSVKVAVKLGAGDCSKAHPIKNLTIQGTTPFVIK